MDKRFDLRQAILSRIDYLSYFKKYIEDVKSLGTDQYKGFCCFHEDKSSGNPGFTFNARNGRWKCYSGCGEGDIFHFVARIYSFDVRKEFRKVLGVLANELGISESGVKREERQGKKEQPKPKIQEIPKEKQSKPSKDDTDSIKATEPLPEELNNRFKADITPELKEILKKKRGFTDETLNRFEIGWHKDKFRYTIPIRDVSGKIRNFRLYSITAEKQWKMINYTEERIIDGKKIKIKYADKEQMFPLYEYIKTNPQRIIICEGEFDCMLLWQHGFHAITGTSGGGTWSDKWNPYFEGKDVKFCYDCDKEGVKFASNHSIKLFKEKVCQSVSVVTLPLSGEKTEKDITDWFNVGKTAEELHKILDDAKALIDRDNSEVAPPDVADDFKRSDYCSRDGKIILRRWRNEYYIWMGRHHQLMEDDRVIADVLQFIAEKYDRNKATQRFANDVLKNLWSSILLPRDMDPPMSNLDDRLPRKIKNHLSMGNGIVNLTQIMEDIPVEIIEHSPDMFFTYSLPYPYVTNAECPRWLNFLEKVQPDQSVRDFLQEYSGYMLVPDVEFQKFLLFIGEGQNGKSVFLDVVTAMLGGPDNVSSISLSKFQGNFALSGMVGKLANICGEVGDIEQIAEEKLKSIVGGDLVEIEEKYKKPYYTKLTGKHIFSTNHLPRFRDRTLGLWRKMSVIDFAVTITEEEKDERLKHKIIDEELSGVFKWALGGLIRLINRGKFVEPKMCTDKKEEVSTEINSAKKFIKDTLEFGQGEMVNCVEIYKEYNDWCKSSNYRPVNEVHFGRQIFREFGKNKISKIRNPNLDRSYCYVNLRRKDFIIDSSYLP